MPGVRIITDTVSGSNSGQDSKMLNKRIILRLKSRVEVPVAEGGIGLKDVYQMPLGIVERIDVSVC